MALISASEYKTWAGVAGSSFDDQIDEAVAAADQEVKAICNRDLESATYTEIVDGTGTELIRVRETPIDSITSVSILFEDGSTSELESESYQFDADTGHIFRTSGSDRSRLGLRGSDHVDRNPFDDRDSLWPDRPRSVQVVYVGGYAAIPERLKIAAYQFVDAWLLTIRSGALVSPSNAVGGVQRSYKSIAETQMEMRSLLREFIWRPGL